MNLGLMSKALELIKNISELCKKVVDASDGEKYAKSVNDLNDGVSNTYNEMRKIIAESNKFSDEEKIAKLSELALQEEESKRRCGEAIQGNRESIANIVMEVFKGLLTCGIYFMPAIINNLKKTTNEINSSISDNLLPENKTDK